MKSKSRRSGSRAKVTFDFSATSAPQTPCQHCGGEVEQVPMLPNTCYDCYRKIADGEIEAPRREEQEEQAYTEMDQVLGVEGATQRDMENMVDIFIGQQAKTARPR